MLARQIFEHHAPACLAVDLQHHSDQALMRNDANELSRRACVLQGAWSGAAHQCGRHAAALQPTVQALPGWKPVPGD
jgi:hypothetical protein